MPSFLKKPKPGVRQKCPFHRHFCVLPILDREIAWTRIVWSWCGASDGGARRARRLAAAVTHKTN
jgi:hypothetical protein